MNEKTEWVDFKEIKEKVSMEDILGHYKLLKGLKRKGNELKGFCPIHDKKHYDKTSFCANTAKNNWHCFSCGAGGNILDFTSAMEGVDIRQAGVLIQKWFGIAYKNGQKLTKEKDKVEKTEKKAEPEKESKESEQVNPPLTFELKTLDVKHPYLKERGLEKETIKEFGLGYCKRGLMKDRIAIPIHNEKGDLVAYTGRYPGDPLEEEPEYKLPPKFKKHLVLFNLNRAKDLAKENGLIVVKGFFDVFNLWQAGYKNVVALMGTSMSDEQEKLVVEAVGENGKVVLMFGEEEAGRSGSEDILGRLVCQMYVRLIKLGKEGLQPDKLTGKEIEEILFFVNLKGQEKKEKSDARV